MQFVRLVVFGFLLLGVIYFGISLYSRSIRKEKLEEEWDKNLPEDATAETRDAFIAKGMAKYESGLRKKLILLVFVIPPLIVGTIIYFIN
ncbi:hypothetical protein Q4555_06640 [Octadecabacter sp. 1_MG-2023]|uniref:hypothetical protein n=1 Tax=unclassified Octadecabacter TaxID=196158 RepID=UPI001C08C3E0|nr:MULTISPECIES: hypothetical protein [unclassified Octadecabacter]MBU2994372.1 hypothetical protein [Octadecabacter sp. B2R22]MDO6734338.1 hypothetical protein [Octadecabacter sp. 1_MG-2023]